MMEHTFSCRPIPDALSQLYALRRLVDHRSKSIQSLGHFETAYDAQFTYNPAKRKAWDYETSRDSGDF